MLRHAIALGLAGIVGTAAVTTAPAAAQSASADLERIESHLKAVDTMTANFRQIDRRGQVLTGKLTLKRPGHIRFQYQKDVPLLIVGDGRTLTMIDYEVSQVQRWPIKNSPLSALLDPDRNLSRYGKLMPTNHPDVLSVEVRDPKRPEYGVITMIFTRKAGAPAGLQLNGWVALDSQNNRTRVELSGQRFNQPVASRLFTWKDPRKKSRRP